MLHTFEDKKEMIFVSKKHLASHSMVVNIRLSLLRMVGIIIQQNQNVKEVDVKKYRLQCFIVVDKLVENSNCAKINEIQGKSLCPIR